MFRTWIRVEDEYGQFDLPKDAPLPAGVKKVPDYPEHVGQFARDGKPKIDKGGAAQLPEGEPTDAWKVPQIDAYAEANDIDLSGASNKTDKLAAIAAAGTQTPDDQSGTGKTNTEAGTPGEESE